MSKQIIEAFRDLTAKERISLYGQIKEAIAKDGDMVSGGRDPGTIHWDELLNPPAPVVSKAKMIDHANFKHASE